MAQFFVDLDIETRQRPKLYTTFRQFEDEQAQLRRQVNEPSPSSLLVPFRIDPPCSIAFQDKFALNNAQKSQPVLTITLEGASNTASKPRLPEQPQALLPTQRTPGPSLDLEHRIKQLDEKVT